MPSTSLLLHLSFELPLVCFHVSVIACILWQIHKRDKVFSTSFFVIYVTQSFMELTLYSMSLIFLRLSHAGITPKFMLDSPVGNIGFALLGYSHYYQLVAHSAIAVNRYCIIASRCQAMWDGGWSRLMYFSLFALPVPGIGLHFVSKIVAVETTPGVYVVVFEQKWIFAASTLAALFYVLFTAPLTAIFELKTFVAYRQLSFAAKKRHRHDFHLFVYALTQLVAHVGWTIWFILMAVAGATGDQGFAGAVQPLSLYLLDVSCLTGPICLFFTSKTLRKCYGELFWRALLGGRSSTITSVTRVTPQWQA